MEKRQMQVCDRISALPDALLCHILSFLPTIYAVRTTCFVSQMEEHMDFYSQSTHSRCRTFELPQSLLMCKTLVVLKLWSNFIINTPTSSGCFPALKSLNVSFESSDNYSIEKLFSHFPVLEDLTIKAIFPLFGPTEDLNVNILAPKLKSLKVVLHVHGDLQCDFHIDAPKLENLHLKGPVLSSFSLEKAQSLVKAVLNNRNSREQLNRGTALLERISSVKSLYLEALGLEVSMS
ncbi:hypothetical protein M0R45_014453 [Rubus argutus]|uniref:F-box/LRR-repeat protein 15/At3g58940/PEG3-like LRR domain-containing protein n=1 Tax=Rubus argutus TaxID=59490 RepID=A0AAW1XNW6_RUBAR